MTMFPNIKWKRHNLDVVSMVSLQIYKEIRNKTPFDITTEIEYCMVTQKQVGNPYIRHPE